MRRLKFNYSIILLFTCVISILVGCDDGSAADSTKRPNIPFIMSDDHTSQAWGIYGGVLADYVRNKHIQRLANEGMVLDNVFCTNSICVPSRASILTGQYSHKNGVYTLSDSLHTGTPTIAGALQKTGYETAIIGKWHLKAQPGGFDHWEVLPGQGRYYDPILRTRDNWSEGGKTYDGFSADVITDLSLEWLKDRDSEEPFFLMTHFKATHEPFDYPERLEHAYDDVEFPEPESLYDFSPETNGRTFLGQKLWILGERWVRASQNKEYQRYPGLPFDLDGLDSIAARKKIYQKFVRDFLRSGAAIDENIGRLLDHLDEAGLAENTVVIYTADQGYFLGEHGMFDKRMMYEEALRMPFVIRYPLEIQAGTRADDMVLNIDFPALFADYAGIAKPDFVDGSSFRKNLQGETDSDWRNEMYYRYWLHRAERPAHFGVRTDRYKLIYFYGQPLSATGAMTSTTEPGWEFYDLIKDPDELRNAYDDPSYRGTIDALTETLVRMREEWSDTDSENQTMQEVLPEALRAVK